MKRRWLVVQPVGEYRVIVSRHWTKKGAERFIESVEANHNYANHRARKNTAPGSPPLPSPYPYPVDLVIQHLEEEEA